MEKIFEGKLLKVFKGKKVLPNGKTAYLEEIEHPGASLIVPFVGKNLLFLKQYRGVIDEYIWELPAGKLEPGESPYKCAKRELEEETGYRARTMKKIGMIYTTPGFCDEKIHIYKAVCDTDRKDLRLNEDEMIKVRALSVGQVRKLFKAGKITDSKSIAGLAFAGILARPA